MVRGSRNGTFLLERRYIEYHSDRFQDHSLVIEEDGNPIAVFPATVSKDSLVSHSGLTYGGLIYGRGMRAANALDSLSSVLSYARAQGLKKVYYKPVPTIYHIMPAQEDLYALFRFGAILVRRDISSSLDMRNRYTISKGRKACISKVRKSGLHVEKSDDFHSFMQIKEEFLASRHRTRPTHTAVELRSLAAQFPDNIQLYITSLNGEMLAGMVVYKTSTVCHAQYIAVSETGKKIAAGDALTQYILEYVANTAHWFDFGISTTNEGHFLDENLVANKESWGARATMYDHYEIVL
jgi:hypothetical protein